MLKKFIKSSLILMLSILLVGCATTETMQQKTREQAATIINLSNEVKRLNTELDKLTESKAELAETKLRLENKLKDEIAKGELKVEMQDRGVVVTMLTEVLFDPGKTIIKPDSKKTLEKVAQVINDRRSKDNLIYIEGHTDNVPIKYSGYKSNWELSTTRATEVLHFFVDCKVNPARISATGYGKYRPVAPNNIAQGRAKNRRVEVIISPDMVTSREVKHIK